MTFLMLHYYGVDNLSVHQKGVCITVTLFPTQSLGKGRKKSLTFTHFLG